MGKFKEFIQSLGKKSKERKELLKRMDDQMRVAKTLEERQKSANQRELEGYYKEDREAQIKEDLEYMREKRDRDIKFGHNPLDTKNIMKSEWEVLKEPNQFSGRSNMFRNNDFIHKNNKKLLHNGNILNNNGNILNNDGNILHNGRGYL